MIRFLIRLGALLAACLAHGAWDTWAGSPLIERMEPALPLRFLQPAGFAQHPVTGEIVVGDSEQIFSFDGANWRNHKNKGYHRVLVFNADSTQLWSGGDSEFGFFRRDQAGNYLYESLVSHVPPGQQIGAIWGCWPRGSGADFVTTQKVMRWDGSRLQLWDFPTAGRLFPVYFEGALWFSHPESGLYRMGEHGPELIAPKSDLPPRMPMWLSRRGRQLVGWSPDGVITIGAVPSHVGSTELTAALAEGNPAAITPLPNGLVAIGTVRGGLLIADLDGNLISQIPYLRNSRPPATTVWALMRDRNDALWIAIDGRLVRLPAPSKLQGAIFNLEGVTPSLDRITSDAATVQLLGDRELHTFHRPIPGTVAPAPKVTDLGTMDARALASSPAGLLATAHREIRLLSGEDSPPELKFSSRTIYGLQRLRPDIELLATREYNRVSLLQPLPEGRWDRKEMVFGDTTPSSIAMDWEGYLWMGRFGAAPVRYRVSQGTLQNTTPPEISASSDKSSSWVFHSGDSLWLVQRSQIWRVARDGQRVRLPFAAPADIVTAAPSPDGRRIYVALNRSVQGTRAPHGLGIIELSERGEFRGWREPWLPGLHVLGQIYTLHATQDTDGVDRLWMVGQGGMLNLRLDALGEWTRPQAPLLAPTLADEAEPSRLPFDGHAITLRLQSTEIARRPELRFETRLVRDGKGEWAPAATQDLFEFSNLTDGRYRFEARTVTPTGGVSAPVAFSFRVLPPWYRSSWAYAGYAAVGLIGVIGAMRYRERRVRARNAELERLVALRTAELEKANAAKDEFLASMSHEIRNPMNGVVGLSAAIDTAPLDPEGRHRFDLLRHCAAHLATLLEDILDFSRLQSGRIELHEAPFAPAQLLESVVAITAADAAAAGLPVKTALAPHTPARLVGDARRLRQILLNYVSNALKYAGRGEVDVTAWTRPAADGRVELTFAVTDEGPGIPPDEQPKVFAKFERGSAARLARIPGTGMGLAVCRTLAEQMGGRVWLESEPGQGSTFYFAVPLAPAAAAPLVPEPLTAAIQRIRKTALVVDDEDYNRIAHAALLERHGFEVRTAHSGEAALAVSAKEKFDVVLLDYDMPDVTGPELARQLRAQHPLNGRRPFFIAATAYSTVEKRQECLAAGMDAFLGKPLVDERLREAIAAILQNQPVPIADDLVPSGVEEPSDPDDYVADKFDNLRLLAAHKGRTLDIECAHYSREFALDLETLHEAIQRGDAAVAARTAHQLAGRFAFLHERATAELALELERLCRSHRWPDAARFERVLAETWQQLRPSLNRSPIDPGA